MENSGLITVTVTKQGELQAVHADLYVKIQGASVVSGGQALEKAREVAQLVRELTSVGLPPEDVHLQGATADVSSGTLVKTSQASYRLRIHCASLSALPNVLGVITSQKNTSLSQIEWGYPDEEALKDEWLYECAARAHEKARRIASSLGVRLTGLHRFTEAYQDRDDSRIPEPPAMRRMVGEGRSRITDEEFGLDVSHAKTIGLRVVAEYHVSGYGDDKGWAVDAEGRTHLGSAIDSEAPDPAING